MTFTPTTTVSILRGTTVNDWGDEVDSDTTVATGIPASVMERTLTDIDPSSGDPRTARAVVGGVPAGTDVRDGDRLRDERTDITYAIRSISALSNPVFTPSVRLDLDRTT